MRYIFIASCIMCYSWSIFIFCCVFTVFNKVGPHHIYFGVRHAPMYCIFILERDTLHCTAYLFWSETRSAVLHHVYFGVRHAPYFASCLLWSETRSTCFAYERSIFIVIILRVF